MPLVMLVLISSVYAAVAAPKYASADADAEQQVCAWASKLSSVSLTRCVFA